MSVEVEAEAEAVDIILEEGKKHVQEAHKDLPMDEAMLKQLIQTNIKKV
jgi:predicted small metal-binding protein